jgi:hypothetical protein
MWHTLFNVWKCASFSKHNFPWNFILLDIFSRDDDPFTHSLHIGGVFSPIQPFEKFHSLLFVHWMVLFPFGWVAF